MSYHTTYNLDVTPEPSEEEFTKLCEFDENLDDLLNDNMDDCSWYENEEDMKLLSADFPEFTFTLKGVGENQGDIWTKIFKAGEIISDKRGRLLDPEEVTDYDEIKNALGQALTLLDWATAEGLSSVGKDEAKALLRKLSYTRS